MEGIGKKSGFRAIPNWIWLSNMIQNYYKMELLKDRHDAFEDSRMIFAMAMKCKDMKVRAELAEIAKDFMSMAERYTEQLKTADIIPDHLKHLYQVIYPALYGKN